MSIIAEKSNRDRKTGREKAREKVQQHLPSILGGRIQSTSSPQQPPAFLLEIIQ